jgi:hypothetical protein
MEGRGIVIIVNDCVAKLRKKFEFVFSKLHSNNDILFGALILFKLIFENFNFFEFCKKV